MTPRLPSDSAPVSVRLCRLALLVWLSPVIVLVFGVGCLILGCTWSSRGMHHLIDQGRRPSSRVGPPTQLAVSGLPARGRSASRPVGSPRPD